MRIKNQKVNYERYLKLEKANYDEIVCWIKKWVTEQTKSKAKIIQSKLLHFFEKEKKLTTVYVATLLNALKAKYLNGYPIELEYDVVNSLDDDKTLFFNIYMDFNGYYRRQLIQENRHPNIDEKLVILDLEITDEELSDSVREKTIKDGDFEEI